MARCWCVLKGDDASTCSAQAVSRVEQPGAVRTTVREGGIARRNRIRSGLSSECRWVLVSDSAWEVLPRSRKGKSPSSSMEPFLHSHEPVRPIVFTTGACVFLTQGGGSSMTLETRGSGSEELDTNDKEGIRLCPNGGVVEQGRVVALLRLHGPFRGHLSSTIEASHAKPTRSAEFRMWFRRSSREGIAPRALSRGGISSRCAGLLSPVPFCFRRLSGQLVHRHGALVQG